MEAACQKTFAGLLYIVNCIHVNKISYLSGISHLANLATCLLPEFGSLRDRLPSPASNPTCAGMSSVCGVYLPSLTIQSKSRA